MNTFLIMASIIHCYVGCNTGAEDLQTLHVLECDTETGAAKIVQTVKGVQGTTYFQLDQANKYLYSVVGEKRDTKSTSAVVRFPIDGWRLGAMERLAELPCEAPCHVSLLPDESRVACAAYLSATASSVSTDGKDVKTYVFPDDAMGPNAKRQKKAYAHFTFAAPAPTVHNLQPTTKLGVIDLGCDRIRFFDPKTMVPDLSMDIRFDPGDGPRHAVWSKDGKFLYVLCELGSRVYSFEYCPGPSPQPSALNSQPSGFRKVGSWSMLPADFNRWEADGETLATKAAAIKLTDDGKILMASNRGHDSVAFYAVDTATGRLTLRNIAKLTGKFPRDFELMPGEKFMVVGHKMSNEIQVYRFDRADCTLTPAGAPISAWRPLCFKFGAL